MPHFGKIIESLALKKGIGNRERLAVAAGVSLSTMRTWIKSSKPPIRGENLVRLANAVGVSVEELNEQWEQCDPDPSPSPLHLTGDADASRQDPMKIGHNIRLRSFTSAGPATDYADNIFSDRYLPSSLIPRPEWGLGAFLVDGDSMEPLIRKGDIVFIGERLQRVRTDDILIIAFKTGEHTMKQLRIIDDQTWELIPRNDTYPRHRISVEEVDWYVPVLGWFVPHYARRAVPFDEDS